MEIYIDGEQLDVVKGQDVELNWNNIRFSEAIADEWSTDVELSNTDHNVRKLNAYGLLDRGAIFHRQVPCSVIIKEISYDGYLHITEFTPDTITATVYLLAIPYSLYDKEISDYYPDDDNNTIFRWDRLTPHTTTTAVDDIAVYEYNYNSDYFSNLIAQLHPSVRAEKIMQNIQTAEDVTLPTLDSDLFLTATKKVVCPQNRFQCFMARYKDSAPPSDGINLVGGQHITNDFACDWSYKDIVWNNSWTDWDVLETYIEQTTNANQNEITFNRSCSCRIWVYGNTNRATWNVHIYRNNEDLTANYIGGTNLYRMPNGSNDTAPSWDVNDCLAVYLPVVTFSEDDVLSFKLGVSSGSALNTTANISILIEYTAYDITDDDYSTELEYYPVQFGLGYSYLNGAGTVSTDGFRQTSGTGFGVNGFLDHSLCYYGLWANMGSCSVRDFISNMCWVHNRKLKLDKYELIFSNAYQAREIDGNITAIQTITDKLGKKNIVTYQDDHLPTWWTIDNDFLEKEVTIFESIFTTSKYKYGKATIEQYEFENQMTEPNSAGESWVEDIKVNLEEFDFLLFELVQNGTRYRLQRAPELTDFALSDITSTICATIETYDEEVRDKDYVYLDGRKYLVVEGTIDMGSGLAELQAIEIPTVYGGECAAPSITFSFNPSVTDCYVTYNLLDNTMAGTYTLKVFENGNLVDSYNLEIGTTRFLSISGLSAGTTYTITIKGGNDCGNLTETGTFTTMSGYPPQVTINQIFNINAEGATVDFTITEQ